MVSANTRWESTTVGCCSITAGLQSESGHSSGLLLHVHLSQLSLSDSSLAVHTVSARVAARKTGSTAGKTRLDRFAYKVSVI